MEAATINTAAPLYLGDLEKCGIATSNNLRELLTTCADPVEAIKQFQVANSVQLPSLKPVMKLLDLHGISRADYHETVITELTERLVSKLRSLGNNQTPENVHRLERHLERCFRLYRVPRIRPIELYDQCSVSVRQQIWVKNETLFLESIEPILDSYISEERRQHLIFGEKGSDVLNESLSEGHGQQLLSPGINVTSSFFAGEVATKQRQLISMIGLREQLYTRLVDTLRERFLATENPYYCSLRFDLLMALRDVNMEFYVCHDFAWCLDACSKHLRTKHLDVQQLNKLKTLLESGGGGKKCQNKAIIIPEMAMIAGDPHILHLIASFAVKMLRDNAASPRPHLPKEMGSLQLLLKLLVMGVHCKSLLLGEEQLINLIEGELKEVVGHFLPSFSTMLVQEKYLCSLLWLHHLVLGGEFCPLSGTIKRRQLFDPSNAFRYSIKDPWVQLLVQKLMQFPACLSNELTANLFIQQFFIPNLKAKISRGGGPPPLPQQLSSSSSTPSITSCSSKESCTNFLMANLIMQAINTREQFEDFINSE
uniref:Negative elongation factor B n=1 Tax=Meloidogyne floridensis TaxID=298350 RepID=A0A915NGI0_9BILA